MVMHTSPPVCFCVVVPVPLCAHSQHSVRLPLHRVIYMYLVISYVALFLIHPHM